jgi:hypothetical protein
MSISQIAHVLGIVVGRSRMIPEQPQLRTPDWARRHGVSGIRS